MQRRERRALNFKKPVLDLPILLRSYRLNQREFGVMFKRDQFLFCSNALMFKWTENRVVNS